MQHFYGASLSVPVGEKSKGNFASIFCLQQPNPLREMFLKEVVLCPFTENYPAV